VRRAITINVCWQKSSCELFPSDATHAKVAVAVKWWYLAFSLSFLAKHANGESFWFFSFFGEGYQWWKFLFFLCHFWPKIPMVKALFFLGQFWPRLLTVKVLFFMDIFGQGYFYWPLRLWTPMMKVMFVIWDFEQPLASRSAKREFAFAEGNLMNPTVQAGVRAPWGNCWHGIASTSILVHR